MLSLANDQLDALRRQIEDEYRQDITAIERIRVRFGAAPVNSSVTAPSLVPAVSVSSTATIAVSSDFGGKSGEPVATLPARVTSIEPRTESHSDELTQSLRAMFSSSRR